MQAVRSFQLSVPISSVGWVPILAIGLRLASPTTADASYLLLGAFALTGRVQAIQALALSWFFTFFNSGITSLGPYSSLGRYVVILGAAVSVLMRSDFLKSGKMPDRLISFTILLAAFVVIHSILFSIMPDISLLKIVSWVIPVVTLLAAWSRLSLNKVKQLSDWLYAALVLIMVLSLPLIAFPVGYSITGTAVIGVIGHPQAFGITMSVLGAWTVGRMFAQHPPPWTSIIILGLCLALIVLSETRTAGLGLVLGVAMAMIISPLIAGKPLRKIAPGLLSRRFQIIIFISVFAAVAAGSQATSIVTDYISKGRRAQVTGVLEAYDDSRGRLIDEMWQNFENNPWTGIGFGLPSDLYEFNVVRDPFLGLPIAAPIEKGVAPIMVLEELGIVGAVMVLVWVWMLFRRAAARGIASLTLLATILLLNFGEAGLLSSGGIGLLYLVAISWAVARPTDR